MSNTHYPHKITLESHEITPFEVIAQPDRITCGPTSVTMVLRRYGKNVTLDEVRKHTKTDWITIKGQKVGLTSPDFIVIAMKEFGVPVTLKSNCNLGDIRYFVSNNRPPIIIVRTAKYLSHYVVVIGYNKNSFILADPCGERWEIKNEVLNSCWGFMTDTNGEAVSGSCPLCFGTGNILGVNLSPLTFCELCNGTGKMIDLTALIHIWADVYPNTMIIPREACQ